MRKRRSFITLLTDFGVKDVYVASMKGVIYSFNPNVNIIDITHEISPQDIEQAAFQILISYDYFPKGTIHMIVVDPGVGSHRKIIAVKTKKYIFIAPDNGVLSYVLMKEKKTVVRQVWNKKYYLKEISHTFHGRDIFAPIVAHISKRRKVFSKLGPICKSPVLLSLSEVKRKRNSILGRVIHVDTFGNLITNINCNAIKKPIETIVSIKRRKIKGVSTTYASGGKGKIVAIVGSSGLVEIARRDGNASKYLNAKKGTKVTLYFK